MSEEKLNKCSCGCNPIAPEWVEVETYLIQCVDDDCKNIAVESTANEAIAAWNNCEYLKEGQ